MLVKRSTWRTRTCCKVEQFFVARAGAQWYKINRIPRWERVSPHRILRGLTMGLGKAAMKPVGRESAAHPASGASRWYWRDAPSLAFPPYTGYFGVRWQSGALEDTGNLGREPGHLRSHPRRDDGAFPGATILASETDAVSAVGRSRTTTTLTANRINMTKPAYYTSLITRCGSPRASLPLGSPHPTGM